VAWIVGGREGVRREVNRSGRGRGEGEKGMRRGEGREGEVCAGSQTPPKPRDWITPARIVASMQ